MHGHKIKISGPQDPVPYKSDTRGMKIELRDVSFRYKTDSPNVIKNVNFTIEPGQMVSIVGYNGSGYSTTLEFIDFEGKQRLCVCLHFSKHLLMEIFISTISRCPNTTQTFCLQICQFYFKISVSPVERSADPRKIYCT